MVTCARPAGPQHRSLATLTAADLMTADPITVDADVLVVKALERMEHNRQATADLGPACC